MKTVFLTDRGRVRKINEDNAGVFLNEAGIVLALVADGMGGHLAGDVASEMAVKQLQALWEQENSISTPEQAEEWLKENVLKVNKHLYRHALENPECQGMGTTLVAAVCTEAFATIGHIGDSRCYLLNSSGFKQITEDHSLVNELVRSGQITKEAAEQHPRKNVLLRALGTEDHVELEVSSLSLEESETLLLCSDGLSNKVSDEDIAAILKRDQPLEEKAETLISHANENGGEDNITIVIAEQTAASEKGEQTC
ncbi:Stp1/IreP family PP2C-type Ser/Thr phosphatase [Bacillus lacus]|uniref:protein-serine/threonine phosphatase n=1 Tax=Metabacillus lacus TaxID=1983721 RepID=A0A7X2M0W8_9BACI|nr:Stp1/IreP family PP2C-type Ser/Thr phosphatase [Metabacillus lacus]